MLVSLKDVLLLAEKGGFAVPAFNVYNMETVMGISAAAEELNAPIILQSYSRLFTNGEAYYLAPIIRAAAEKCKVPIAFHLDHGAGVNEVTRALRYGATGIMIDGSTLPFEENIALTKVLVDGCASVGVPVEGELGHIGSVNDEIEAKSTEVSEAVEYAEKTGVAALAIMVGTAHGRYKKAPKLDIDRIAEIHAATEASLVLHGGSGIPDDQIRSAIKAGIRKVNFGTDVCFAFLDKVFETDRSKYALDLFMKDTVNNIKSFAEEKIKLLSAHI